MLAYLKSHNIKNIKKSYDNELIFSCPFHHDRTPSASINMKKKVFNCFVCGGFSMPQFIAKLENCTIHEAFRILKEEIPYPTVNELVESKLPIPELPINDLEVVGATARSAPAVKYLESRKISVDMAAVYGVSYIWRGEDDGCLVLPFYCDGYKGYQTRRIVGMVGKSKRYRTKKGSVADKMLYNMDRLVGNAHEDGVWVVEGPMDVLKLQSLNICTLGLLRNKMNKSQFAQIIRMDPNYVVVYLDPDCSHRSEAIASDFRLLLPSYYVRNPSADPAALAIEDFKKLDIREPKINNALRKKAQEVQRKYEKDSILG